MSKAKALASLRTTTNSAIRELEKKPGFKRTAAALHKIGSTTQALGETADDAWVTKFDRCMKGNGPLCLTPPRKKATKKKATKKKATKKKATKKKATKKKATKKKATKKKATKKKATKKKATRSPAQKAATKRMLAANKAARKKK